MDIPLEIARKIERKHVVFLIIGLSTIYSAGAILPAELAMMVAWDATLYADIAIATWMAARMDQARAIANRIKQTAGIISGFFRKAVKRAPKPRNVRKENNAPPANDDDRTEWALAA